MTINNIIKEGVSKKTNREFQLLDRPNVNEEYRVIQKLKNGKIKEIYKNANFINCSVYFNQCF